MARDHVMYAVDVDLAHALALLKNSLDAVEWELWLLNRQAAEDVSAPPLAKSVVARIWVGVSCFPVLDHVFQSIKAFFKLVFLCTCVGDFWLPCLIWILRSSHRLRLEDLEPSI